MNLVTGATGFLGSHVVEQLIDLGRPVRVLVRPSSNVEHLEPLGVQIARGSLNDEGSLATATRGVVCIYHCAAKASDFGRWREFQESNVDGVARLVRAASAAGVERFIHVSTTDVYGHPNRPVDEGSPFRKRGWPYGDTKIDGEEVVWRAFRENSLPVTVIRPASIYGPRSLSLCLEVVELLKKGQMMHIGNGGTVAGLGYVTNVVDVMILAADSSRAIGQAYNVCDGTNHTWRQYVEALADVGGLKRPTLGIPRRLAYVTGWAMEKIYSALRSQNRPLLTRMAVEMFGSNQGFPIDKARRELGYTPRVGFDEGMQHVGEWLRENSGCSIIST